MVAAFVQSRAESGLTTSPTYRAIIGKYGKALLANGWSAEVVLAAAKEYAATGRHPRFLEEWVNETQARWDDIQHDIRKAQEREPMSDEVMAAIFAGTHGKPLIQRIPREEESVDAADLRYVTVGPRCYECALSGRLENCQRCAYAIQQVKNAKG